MKVKLKHQEARVMDYLENHPTISSAVAQEVCGSPDYKQSANLLLRMEKNKLLKKVSRGIYTIGIKRIGTQKELKFKLAQTKPKEEKPFNFVVEDNWKQKKVFYIDDFTNALIEAVKQLNKGQSIQVPVAEIKKRYDWNTERFYLNQIKYRLAKRLSKNFMGNLKFFNERDANGNIYAIRIVYYYGV